MPRCATRRRARTVGEPHVLSARPVASRWGLVAVARIGAVRGGHGRRWRLALAGWESRLWRRTLFARREAAYRVLESW